MIETVRLSEKARNQLISLKRKTGIENWNTLCRWAFCASLAEPSIPPPEEVPSDSSVEMSWRVFSGGHEALYWGLLLLRAKHEGVPNEKEALLRCFRLHLHRGISYLNGNAMVRNIGDLVRYGLASREETLNQVVT
jgi:DNA sulfur modification protein DndE